MHSRHAFVGTIASLALLLPGCEGFIEKRDEPTKPEPAKPQPAKAQQTKLFVNGKPINELDAAELRKQLSDLPGFDLTDAEGRKAARAALDRLDKGAKLDDTRRQSLSGLDGHYARLALEAALARSPRPKVRLSGLITHYRFNEGTRSGYLEVDTKDILYVNGNREVLNEYTWWIAVRHQGYIVQERQEDSSGLQFPGTIPLPPGAEANLDDRGLDHKLFAEGDPIEVLGVVKNGQLLPADHPYYDSSDASCIDLLFNGGPPREQLPDQHAYCLGRCAHPWIVNTGI